MGWGPAKPAPEFSDCTAAGSLPGPRLGDDEAFLREELIWLPARTLEWKVEEVAMETGEEELMDLAKEVGDSSSVA